MDERVVERARAAIKAADAVVITAGAGMGVDSGLPDFRGDEGFWRAYPPLKALGLSFSAMANPAWFERDPGLAWGFYGHRMHLYRDTMPHAGFDLLRGLAERARRGASVFTSNVDGQFVKAGFDAERVVECHGSIHHLQCTVPCSDAIWSAADIAVEVDPQTFRATGELPRCPSCGALARPNILMFGDGRWLEKRSEAQQRRLLGWMRTLDGARSVVLEFGAGGAIPTVRRFGEQLGRQGFVHIRVNPREAEGPPGTLSLAMGARAACEVLLG
jgi:NAD-dependent SIR2 family protein deacetylase